MTPEELIGRLYHGPFVARVGQSVGKRVKVTGWRYDVDTEGPDVWHGPIAQTLEMCHYKPWDYQPDDLTVEDSKPGYTLTTSTWQAIHEHESKGGQLEGYVAVRISRDYPPVPTITRGLPFLPELAHYGKGKQEYLDRLNHIGYKCIDQLLGEIHAYRERPIVLATDEPHRLWFAEWWEDQTGQTVPEAIPTTA